MAVHPSTEGLISFEESDSLASDRYRLLFAKIDLICRKEGKKVIGVTSSVKGEGKTTTTSNLAIVSARDFGKKTLIIDGDFRNPSVSKSFGVKETPGLMNIFSNEYDVQSAVRRGPVNDLGLLTMGRLTNQDLVKQSHIWASSRMGEILAWARKKNDYIFVDSPPVLPLFDMSVISEEVDGILLVVKMGETPEVVLAQAVKSLGTKKVIGTVLNRAKVTWASRYYDYSY